MPITPSLSRTIALPLVMAPNATLRYPVKDPSDTLDFTLDISNFLAELNDTLASWDVTCPSQSITALVLTSQGLTGNLLTTLIGAGTLNQDYPLVYSIVTAGGLTLTRTVWLTVQPVTAEYSQTPPVYVLQGLQGPPGTANLVSSPSIAYNSLTGQASAVFGDTLGTVAQGNDSRLLNALQASNNLSDLGSAPSARSNLGLAALAVLGIGAGLAAAGSALTVAYGITANTALQGSLLGANNGVAPLDSTGKVPLANISAALLGANHYLGAWNPGANTPAIVSGTAPGGANPVGSYYVANSSATLSTAIDGTAIISAGDWLVWDGTRWDHLDGQANPVSSVAGRQGAVTLSYSDIAGLGSAATLSPSTGLTVAGNSFSVAYGTGAGQALQGSLIGANNGLAGLDASGNITANNVIPNDALTAPVANARSLGDIAADAYNIQDYGVKLTGTHDDSAAINALLTALPKHSTIDIPLGNWNTNSGITQPTGKSFFFRALGTLDYLTAAAGTNPVLNIGDGNVFQSFNNNSLVFTKQTINSSNSSPMVTYVLTHGTTAAVGAGAVVSNTLTIANTAVQNSNNGWVWNNNSTLNSGTTARQAQEVNVASSVFLQPFSNATTFGLYTQLNDNSGTDASQKSTVNLEMDIYANGGEVSGYTVQPGTGGRVQEHLVIANKSRPSWPANATHGNGYIVQPSTPNGYTYIASQSGSATTAATEPAWPVAPTVAAITAASCTAGIASFVTATPYNPTTLPAGSQFAISVAGCAPSDYNGGYQLATVVDATHFTVPISTNPAAATTLGQTSGASILDNQMIWTLGAAFDCVVSRSLEIDIGANAFCGTPIWIHGGGTPAVTNAMIQLDALLVDTTCAAIRTHNNAPLDINYQNSANTKNNNIIQYDSVSRTFQVCAAAGRAALASDAMFTVSDPAVAQILPGIASPYTAGVSGQLLFSGSAAASVTIKRGTPAPVPAGLAAGPLYVRPGDIVAWSGAPTVNFVPF